MHAFADLRPYICTFSDCKDELAQFNTRAAWADHEFTQHRYDRIWNCPECSKKFASSLDWEQHLQETHRRVFTGRQLYVARNAANQIQPRPIEAEECPLCRIVVGKPRRVFVKHVGRHMEEVALMALPRSTEEDSDEGSVSTDQNSLGSGNAQVLGAGTGLEVPEEMVGDQTDYRATNFTTNQPGPADLEIENARLNHQRVHSNEDEIGDKVKEIVRCICGTQELTPKAGPGWVVQCDGCKVWQHRYCVGIQIEATGPKEYFCEQCREDLHSLLKTNKLYVLLAFHIEPR